MSPDLEIMGARYSLSLGARVIRKMVEQCNQSLNTNVGCDKLTAQEVAAKAVAFHKHMRFELDRFRRLQTALEALLAKQDQKTQPCPTSTKSSSSAT